MDKIENYRRIIQNLLESLGQAKVLGTDTAEEFETQVICDTKNDHYQLLHLGWQNQKRTFGVSIHIDIKNGKIWIQQNSTDIDIARELVEKAIPKEDIVLGLQAPSMRKYTEFAVA
ncbi:MAG TPA: XisI protein [Pyrinomonadaceae bacterium]|nr:XisI protein [Pyrinomonadaceae bacterium]